MKYCRGGVNNFNSIERKFSDSSGKLFGVFCQWPFFYFSIFLENCKGDLGIVLQEPKTRCRGVCTGFPEHKGERALSMGIDCHLGEVTTITDSNYTEISLDSKH